MAHWPLAAAVALALAGSSLPLHAQGAGLELTALSPQELAEIEVVSPGRKPESLLNVPAAVSVITREEILSAGVTTLADALRLAPGVHVARISSHRFAVGIRGFGSRLSRGVLVMIDGRSVYTPLFAGTYWEVQDVFLPDIERIEVVRGPGGTLWGANAFNGVINVITRRASQTTGPLVAARSGTVERGYVGARHGAFISDAFAASVYGQATWRSALHREAGPEFDDWRLMTGGFQLDGTVGRSRLELHGNVGSGTLGQETTATFFTPPYARTLRDDTHVSGAHILSRATFDLRAAGSLQLQAYWDRTTRSEASFSEERDTVDLSLQHRMRLPFGQEVVSGVGWRTSRDDTGGLPSTVFTPNARTIDILNIYLQDEISLSRDLAVVLGTKVERNDYTGYEWQPSARLLARPARGQTLWAAVSRAVRTPSRLERDLTLAAVLDPDQPLFARVEPNPGFVSERVVAYETGWRVQPRRDVWFDVAFFLNDYERLVSVEPFPAVTGGELPGTTIPYRFGNGVEGRGRGGELSAGWSPVPWWTLAGTYSYLSLDLHASEGSRDTTTAAATEGDGPRHQGTLRSSWSLPGRTRLDATFRALSRLPNQRVPGYATLDLKLTVRPLDGLDIGIVGQNLLTDRHPEFAGGTPASIEVPRSGFLEVMLAW